MPPRTPSGVGGVTIIVEAGLVVQDGASEERELVDAEEKESLVETLMDVTSCSSFSLDGVGEEIGSDGGVDLDELGSRPTSVDIGEEEIEEHGDEYDEDEAYGDPNTLPCLSVCFIATPFASCVANISFFAVLRFFFSFLRA